MFLSWYNKFIYFWMPNRNKQEPMVVNLLYLKSQMQNIDRQCLSFDGCQCLICSGNVVHNTQQFNPIERNENKLHEFIQIFPSIFPLTILPTTVYDGQGHHIHYCNGNRQQNKSYIYKSKVTRLLTSQPMSQNVHVFGNNFNKLIARYETMQFIRKIQQRSQGSCKKMVNKQILQASNITVANKQILQASNITVANKQLPQASEMANLASSLLRINTQNYKGQHKSQNSQVLPYKYNINSKVLYIQPYSQQIPIKVQYDKDSKLLKFDNILREYLDQQSQSFSAEKSYVINEQFWQWVFSQYGQNTFGLFITEFYSRAYTFFSRNIIHKAVFYWIFQKNKSQFGDNTKVTQELGKHKSLLEAQYFIAKAKNLTFKLKLANVKNTEIDYFQDIRSFQEEYQELILERIKTVQPVKQLSKANTAEKKKYIYQSRLDTFQSKMRDLFLKEQNKVINQVEPQKQFQGKQDSNKLARLLLPNMGEFQNIREILNDEFAFQKLVLFQQSKKQKERLKRARQSLLGQNRDLSTAKHIYEQSRVKKKQFASRKIRIRTQY